MLHLHGIGQRTPKAAKLRVKPPLIFFSFNLESSRSLREIWLAAEQGFLRKFHVWSNVKLFLLQRAMRQMYFHLQRSFFSFELSFSVGEGKREKAKWAFPFSTHAFRNLAAHFWKVMAPSSLLPVAQPGQPHLCQIKVKSLERHTVLCTGITKTPIHLPGDRTCPSAVFPFKYSFSLLFPQETRVPQCLW